MKKVGLQKTPGLIAASYLGQSDKQQFQHVSFRSSISSLHEPIIQRFRQYHLVYKETLKAHVVKHLQPLKG